MLTRVTTVNTARVHPTVPLIRSSRIVSKTETATHNGYVFAGAKGRLFVTITKPGKKGPVVYNTRQGKVGRPIYRITEATVPYEVNEATIAQSAFALLSPTPARKGTKASPQAAKKATAKAGKR
jgi:hypothetical protein